MRQYFIPVFFKRQGLLNSRTILSFLLLLLLFANVTPLNAQTCHWVSYDQSMSDDNVAPCHDTAEVTCQCLLLATFDYLDTMTLALPSAPSYNRGALNAPNDVNIDRAIRPPIA